MVGLQPDLLEYFRIQMQMKADWLTVDKFEVKVLFSNIISFEIIFSTIFKYCVETKKPILEAKEKQGQTN